MITLSIIHCFQTEFHRAVCWKISCVFAAVVVRPIQKAEQRQTKEDQIAAEQRAHETDHRSSEPLRN